VIESLGNKVVFPQDEVGDSFGLESLTRGRSVIIQESSTAEVPMKSSVSSEEYMEVGGEDMLSVRDIFQWFVMGQSQEGCLVV
jgi:hypothetical protein